MGSSTRKVGRLLARGLASDAPGIENGENGVDDDPDDFLYKKDRCRDGLNSVTPMEGLLDLRYEDIILQCLPPEYDRMRQTHFEREDCNLADIRRMMSKIYAD